MASNTESDPEVEVTEEVRRDVIVDSVNTKGTTSKVSAVWIYFEKTKEPNQERTGSHRVANCKECGKGIKVVKGILQT